MARNLKSAAWKLPAAIALLAVYAMPASGQDATTTPGATYGECLDLANRSPVQAKQQASDWIDQGGGHPAKHCLIVAMMSLGEYAAAAERLEKLAGAIADDRALKADILAQAGQAWVLAERMDRALAAQTAALELRPEDPELLIDRAIAQAGRREYWAAVDDLNRAHDLAPKRADILILRASAYRFLGIVELARDDIERALAIDPDNPDGLLERGILNGRAGNMEAARSDWQRVIEQSPQSAAAASARRILERLEQGKE